MPQPSTHLITRDAAFPADRDAVAGGAVVRSGHHGFGYWYWFSAGAPAMRS